MSVETELLKQLSRSRAVTAPSVLDAPGGDGELEPWKVAHIYEYAPWAGGAEAGKLSQAICGAVGIPFGIPVHQPPPPGWRRCRRCCELWGIEP